MSEPTDAELIKWAAELCGWSVRSDERGLFMGKPWSNWPESLRDALAFNLIAKFIKSTPERGDSPECNEEWREDRSPVLAAIPSGPMATIRAIYETGVLPREQDDD